MTSELIEIRDQSPEGMMPEPAGEPIGNSCLGRLFGVGQLKQGDTAPIATNNFAAGISPADGRAKYYKVSIAGIYLTYHL